MSLVLLTTMGALCGMVGDPDPQAPERKSDPLGILYALCNIHCTTFTVFLHYGFGSEALGFPGLGALVLIFVCMAADPLMLLWLMAFLVALVIQRIVTWRLLARGVELHSMDGGLPLLMKLLPFIKMRDTALVMEVLMCFGGGVALLSVSDFVGKFVIVAGISLILREAIRNSICNRRVQRMRDQEMEARWLAERFRERGNGY